MEAPKRDIERFRAHLGDTLSDASNLSHDKVQESKEQLRAAMEGFEGMARRQIGPVNEAIHDQGECAPHASREMVVRRPITTVPIPTTGSRPYWAACGSTVWSPALRRVRAA
ncbi:MAG: hypothetical protein JW993_16360 [Sedimentisphaerales bacterium]|nr:hypothetical protein [Sedimentisphaerales bacterium]